MRDIGVKQATGDIDNMCNISSFVFLDYPVAGGTLISSPVVAKEGKMCNTQTNA
jgi:hypothetical protein